MVRTRFSTPTIGRGWMIGEEGEAVTAVDPEGVVRVRGAPWRARTNRATPVPAGDPVRVVEVDGLLLEVEPLEGAAATTASAVGTTDRSRAAGQRRSATARVHVAHRSRRFPLCGCDVGPRVDVLQGGAHAPPPATRSRPVDAGAPKGVASERTAC